MKNRSSSGRDFGREGRPDEALPGWDPLSKLDPPTEAALAVYWLSHCHGFLVDSPEGEVGVVDDVRLNPETGTAEALTVRAGWSLHGRVHETPVTDVVEILPAERRIVVRAHPEPARPAEPQRRRRLRGLVESWGRRLRGRSG